MGAAASPDDEVQTSRAAASALGLDVLVDLMEKSLNGIVVVDAQRRYRYINPAARRAMGYRLDELVGRDFLLNFPAHEHRAMIEHFEASLGGGADIWHATLVRPDGAECEIAYANMVIHIDGQPHGAAIFRDVTELRRAAEQANTLAQLASSASADTDLQTLLESLAQAAINGIGASGCAVVVSGLDDTVEAVGTAGLPDGYASAVRGLPWSTSRMATLPGFAAGRPVVVLRRREAIAGEPELAVLSALLDGLDWLGAVYVPVMNGGRLLGGLAVYLPSAASGPTEAQETFVLALADQAGIAVAMARLVATSRQVAALSERSRLARDLHDSVSQALFAITLQANVARRISDREGRLDGDPLMTVLAEIVRLSKGAVAEMRGLIFELRPESLVEEGVLEALRRQAAAVSAREQVDVDVVGDDPSPRLTDEAMEHAYRVVLEAVHNAVKHSGCRRICIRLESDDREVRLSVIDDGAGFDPAASYAGHLGLGTMRERAATVDGRLTIDSAAGVGTTVTLMLPAAAVSDTTLTARPA